MKKNIIILIAVVLTVGLGWKVYNDTKTFNCIIRQNWYEIAEATKDFNLRKNFTVGEYNKEIKSRFGKTTTNAYTISVIGDSNILYRGYNMDNIVLFFMNLDNAKTKKEQRKNFKKIKKISKLFNCKTELKEYNFAFDRKGLKDNVVKMNKITKLYKKERTLKDKTKKFNFNKVKKFLE